MLVSMSLCRFKAAALPLSVAQEQVALIDPRVIRQVGDRDALTLDIHAAFVANLKQVCRLLSIPCDRRLRVCA